MNLLDAARKTGTRQRGEGRKIDSAKKLVHSTTGLESAIDGQNRFGILLDAVGALLGLGLLLLLRDVDELDGPSGHGGGLDGFVLGRGELDLVAVLDGIDEALLESFGSLLSGRRFLLAVATGAAAQGSTGLNRLHGLLNAILCDRITAVVAAVAETGGLGGGRAWLGRACGHVLDGWADAPGFNDLGPAASSGCWLTHGWLLAETCLW